MKMVHFCLLGLVTLIPASWNVCQGQDSLGMRCVSTIDYWQTVDGIQMVGDMAYVVSGNKFHIVSLADPANPVEVGQASWSDYWGGMGVYVIGNLAYVNPGYGVIVYNVSDPAHLEILADWQPYPGAEIEDFLPLGNVAIMKFLDSDLCLVDISNLGSIHIVGCNFPPNLRGVGMVGDYLCLRYLGLSMWDISDPTLPVQVAEVDTQFWFWGKAKISGNYVYAGTAYDGLRIIDVSSPLQPFEVSSCDSGNCPAVTVAGNHAIVLCNAVMSIWNVANPAQPIFECTFGSQIPFSPSISSSGNLVDVGDMRIHEPSLMMIDISNPQAPVEVSTFGTKGYPYRMAVRDTVGFIAGNYSTILTVNLSNPLQASQLGMSNEEDYVLSFDIAVRENHAYTACGTCGLLVFDITNPVHLDFVMAIDYPTDDITRVVTAGDYAYVIDSDNNLLRIYSLANAAAPEYVNSINCFASLYCGFMAANGYLYFGIGSGFSVYSLSNPEAPQLVGSCNLSGGNFILDLAPNSYYIYVAYEIGGLRVIDISDPTHPTEVGSVGENTWSVAVSGNTLMTFGPDGLRAKDITDRIHPVTVGYYYYPNATDEWIRDMDILGQYLLTISSGNFRVFDCDASSVTPSHPEIVPHEFALCPCYPNPFNATTIIKYSLPQPERISLIIYNIMGRKVATLVDGLQDAGTHSVNWNAINLASGVYIYRLRSSSRTLTQKMVLLR